MQHCQICKSESLAIESALYTFPNITSDCRPWPAGRSVATCKACGTTQRILLPEAETSYRTVYDGYEMFKHAKEATDQVHFGTEGIPQARTEKILGFIEHKLAIPPANILDIGSGSGAGLRALAERFPPATVYGFEPNDRPEERQQALPDNVSTIFTKRPDDTASYDLVTLFHVLEHVEDVFDLLSYIRSILSDNGRLLVQVPYPARGAFDFVIADHIWHFSKQSLASLLKRAGFSVTYIGNELIEKELTLLAAPNDNMNAVVVEDDSTPPDNPIEWLKHYKSFLDELKTQHAELAVYGTGPSGAWAGHVLGDNLVAYLDDDPARIGSDFNGKPIRSPEDIDASLPVVAAFPDYQAQHIAAKNPDLHIIVFNDGKQSAALSKHG